MRELFLPAPHEPLLLNMADTEVSLAKLEERVAALGRSVDDMNSQFHDFRDNLSELKTQVALALHSHTETWEALKQTASGLSALQNALAEHANTDLSKVLRNLERKGKRDRWVVTTAVAAIGVAITALVGVMAYLR